MRTMCFLLAIGPINCDGKETLWIPYNADGDSLTVSVVDEETLGEDESIELFSSTGLTAVAGATVSPGSGPVGTDHVVQVEMLEEFAGDVGRVSLLTVSSRGERSHELVQDSALAGSWVVSVTSLGEEGEERDDQFTLTLWQETDEDDPDGVEAP